MSDSEDNQVITTHAFPNAPPPQQQQKDSTDCRMYQNQYPDVDDLVMVSVRQIADMGAYVTLLEYNNVEGMILLSELSRRRIRSIQKHIRVGKNEVVVVLRVDKEKGYIDLSKRRVSPEDVHSIMRHVSDRMSIPVLEMYERFGWPLYKKFPHAYDGLKTAINNPEAVFGDLDLSENLQTTLLSLIKKRLTPQPVKVRSDIEVTCFAYEGIDAIKAALTAGESESTEDVVLKITLVAPPLYVILTNALDKTFAIALMEKAISRIEAVIKSYKGNMVVKMRPRAVSENDDAELEKMIDEADRLNRDVEGDEDSPEEE